VSLVVLYYKTRPVSVLKLLKLLKLFCIVTIAWSTRVSTSDVEIRECYRQYVCAPFARACVGGWVGGWMWEHGRGRVLALV
jgi:hypothetical protein